MMGIHCRKTTVAKWATSPKTYVKDSIQVAEHLLQEDGDGYVLKSKDKNPFPAGCKPEVNVMDELRPNLASWFLQLISILQWAVKIGCIDIYLKGYLLLQ